MIWKTKKKDILACIKFTFRSSLSNCCVYLLKNANADRYVLCQRDLTGQSLPELVQNMRTTICMIKSFELGLNYENSPSNAGRAS